MTLFRIVIGFSFSWCHSTLRARIRRFDQSDACFTPAAFAMSDPVFAKSDSVLRRQIPFFDVRFAREVHSVHNALQFEAFSISLGNQSLSFVIVFDDHLFRIPINFFAGTKCNNS